MPLWCPRERTVVNASIQLAEPSHWLERLPHEWGEVLARWGEPTYRGAQVFHWIHRQGVIDPAAMTNLPKTLRARLAEEGVGELPLTVANARESSDRTRKLLVRMGDGLDVETVLIPQLERDPDVDDADRSDDGLEGLRPGQVVTQCISSQVGCAMGVRLLRLGSGRADPPLERSRDRRAGHRGSQSARG